MNWVPRPSVALTNLISLVCRLIASCDSEYEYPINTNERSARVLSVYENENISLSNSIVDPLENLEVVTKTGRVRGYFMSNVRGDQIVAFEGIRYAEPPVGERRFKVSTSDFK